MELMTCTLGDICDEVGGVIRTGPFGSQLHESDYKESGVPVIMPKNIVDGKISTEEIARIGESDANRLLHHRLRKCDIVYGRRGDIGRRALITKRENGWLCGTGCIKISLGNSVLDPIFLYYYLGQSDIVSWIYNQAIGATLPNLNTRIIRSIPIRYPPLPTQRKIAAILSAYDDLIENNTRRIKIQEEMAQALYREWFVHFRFPGHEKVRMVDSSLGEIPEGWEVQKVNKICELIDYGYTASSEKEPIGPKFLRITDIVPYMIDWDSVPYCEIPDNKLKKYQLSEGDIVIARTGATTGYAKRINKRHPESVFASYLVRIRIADDYDNYYVGLILESDEYKRFIKANIGGAAQPQANAQVLSSFLILLPSKEIKELFKQNIEGIFDQRETLQVKNENLRRTRDLLLPKLISGELNIENMEIKLENMNS